MRKWSCIIMSMIIVFLSACSGSDNAEQAEQPSEDADLTREYEGTELNVLVKTGYESAAITEFESDFEEATGIELNIEVVDEPTLRNRFVLDASSGTGSYDVVATQFWYMPEYLQGDYLEPLDEYIETSASDWLAVDEMSDGLLETYRGDDGNLYSLPVSTSGGVLIYREDLFEEYNIPVPKTTKDVLEAAKILDEKLPDNIVPFVGRGDASSDSFGSTAGWAWAYGASVLNEQGNKVTIDTPEMKEALNDWVTLMTEYGPEDAGVMGWDTMSEMFRQGRAAMNFDMSGFPSVYVDPESSEVSENVGVTTITGPDGGNVAQWVYGEGLGINKYSENKEAAWLFLQWRTSLEVAEKELEEGIRVDFPHTSIYETELYKEHTKHLSFADQIPIIMESVDTTYWPNVAAFDRVAQALQEEVSLAIQGMIDTDDVIDNAQKNISELIGE